MDKKTLVSLVKKEANKLKDKATKKERMHLDFSHLQPKRSDNCIYGQMTGDCWSMRSWKLIKACAERVYEQPNGNCSLDQCIINGKPHIHGRYGLDRNHFSPIECFITHPENQENGNNKMLIDYLKGERKTLRFKKF